MAQEKLSCPYIQLSSIVDSRNISSQVGCTNQEGLIENLLRLLLVVTLQSRRLVWFAMKGYGEGVVEGLDIGEGWPLYCDHCAKIFHKGLLFTRYPR